MDDRDQVISTTVQWVRQTVGDGRISKAELAGKARASDLSDDAKCVIGELPDREYTADEVVSLVQDDIITTIGSASQAMRGFGGSM